MVTCGIPSWEGRLVYAPIDPSTCPFRLDASSELTKRCALTSVPPSIHPALAMYPVELAVQPGEVGLFESQAATSAEPIELRRRTPPMTCTSCHITFIHLPDPPEPTGKGPWICTHCAA